MVGILFCHRRLLSFRPPCDLLGHGFPSVLSIISLRRYIFDRSYVYKQMDQAVAVVISIESVRLGRY